MHVALGVLLWPVPRTLCEWHESGRSVHSAHLIEAPYRRCYNFHGLEEVEKLQKYVPLEPQQPNLNQKFYQMYIYSYMYNPHFFSVLNLLDRYMTQVCRGPSNFVHQLTS